MRKKVQVIKIDEHIYFVSNDEINYGDKVVSTIDHIVFTWQDIDVKDRTVSDKKVLATTNPDLWYVPYTCYNCSCLGEVRKSCSLCHGTGIITPKKNSC